MFDLIPLFPVPLGVFKIEESLEEDFHELLTSAIFPPNQEGGHSRSTSVGKTDNKILNDFPVIKSIVMKYFIEYVTEIFEFEDVEFKMTTSWLTETKKGSGSFIHNHKNSYFSGVLYFTEDLSQSPIRFVNPLRDLQSILIPAKNYNLFNSNTWDFEVNKGTLIFFPSYLQHGIIVSTSDIVRYSLAFNFFPEGEFSFADSSLRIKIE
jgi:hypothetical protein